MVKTITVALIGNPNTGKSSVFNSLTGLKQKIGNYPGVTVEKKNGFFQIDRTTNVQLVDLPGTYGLNTQSIDQSIVFDLLLNKNNKDFPDVVIVVADVENLKRNLFYTSLQSEFAKNQLLEENSNNQNINTIYFLDNGVLYKKSLAVYKILKELDGFYSYFSILRFIIPIPLSDFIYDIISKNRYKIMGKRNSCKIPNKEEKAYFL